MNDAITLVIVKRETTAAATSSTAAAVSWPKSSKLRQTVTERTVEAKDYHHHPRPRAGRVADLRRTRDCSVGRRNLYPITRIWLGH